MRTSDLRLNQLPPDAYAWYLAYLEALDARDLARFGAFLADDCAMSMNNQPAIRGKAAILEALGAYWATFASLEHDLLNLYGTPDAFALEALNHYTRLDGSAVTLRAVALTDRDPSGRVASLRLYTDTGPLFAGGSR